MCMCVCVLRLSDMYELSTPHRSLESANVKHMIIQLVSAPITLSSLSHTHTHTHTHTCWFLWFMGTLHRRNGFYTEQTVCAIALHLPYT